MAVSSLPELLEALRGAQNEILGTPESAWVEFKSEPYRLNEDWAKIELVKDVTAMANGANGTIVLGVATEKHPTSQQDTADALRPIPVDHVSERQIRAAIQEWVYPSLKINIVNYKVPKDDGFLWSITPFPNDDDRPYLIRGALPPDNKAKITRKYFGLFKRTDGADNVHVPAERIHSLIQRGDRAPASLTPVPSPIDVQPNLEERKAKAEERLREDLAALALEEGQPFWWLQVMPKGKATLKRFFENSADSLWQVLVNPPSVRPSGFRLPQGDEPENIDDGLRTTRGSSLLLSVLRSGTMTVIIGPEFLTWAMEPYTHKPTAVNPLSLTEIALNALRLYQTEVIPRTEVHLDESIWRTGVGHLSAKSILYMPKVFRIGFLTLSQSSVPWPETGSLIGGSLSYRIQNSWQLTYSESCTLPSAWTRMLSLALETVRSQSRNCRSTNRRSIQDGHVGGHGYGVFPTRRQA